MTNKVLPKRPMVFVFAETSIDGKTAPSKGASSKPMMVLEDIELKQFRHECRAIAGAIMVGSNTVRTDNPLLTVRDASGLSPLRVIPCSLGNLPPESNVLVDGNPTLIAVSAAARPAHLRRLRQRPAVEIVICGEHRTDLSLLLSTLGARGINSVMVEGGGRLLRHLLFLDVVDEFIITQIPTLFGGEKSQTMIGGERLQDSVLPRFELTSISKVGRHPVIRYRRVIALTAEETIDGTER
jgi:2,5-diamino-6-(ribosylamino)-4(3H)-pyrimidinone 5'-phosphate reductase